MTNYCYLDKYKILHAVEKKQTALDNSPTGKILPVEVEAQGGFPTVGNQQVYAYSATDIYVGGNSSTGIRLADCSPWVQHAVNDVIAKVSKLW